MAGRPKIQVTDELCKEAGQHAANGLTKKEIAHNLGFTYATLRRRAKENSSFSNAIKMGQAKGIGKMANALMMAGLAGNVTAMIFYLKNRAPDTWKDRLPEGFVGDTPEPESIKVIIVDNRKPQSE